MVPGVHVEVGWVDRQTDGWVIRGLGLSGLEPSRQGCEHKPVWTQGVNLE